MMLADDYGDDDDDDGDGDDDDDGDGDGDGDGSRAGARGEVSRGALRADERAARRASHDRRAEFPGRVRSFILTFRFSPIEHPVVSTRYQTLDRSPFQLTDE